jgi:hypothetical protein
MEAIFILCISKLNEWFLRAVTAILTTISNHGVATKVIGFTLFTVTLPRVLRQFLVWIFTSYSEGASEIGSGLMQMYGIANNGSGLIPSSISWTGFAGYMVFELGLDHAVATILVFSLIRLLLSFIPLVGPK